MATILHRALAHLGPLSLELDVCKGMYQTGAGSLEAGDGASVAFCRAEAYLPKVGHFLQPTLKIRLFCPVDLIFFT